MIIKLRKYIVYLRNKLICFLENIIGERKEFNFNFRFFNSICIIIAISYIARILIDLILGNRIFELTLSHIISSFSILSIFYISRFLKKPEISKFLIFLIVLLSFSFEWLYAGGTSGITLYFYLMAFSLLILITKKGCRILSLLIIISNITALFIIEFKYPHLIIHKTEVNKLYISKYFYFIIAFIIIALIIQIARKLGGQERLILYKQQEAFSKKEKEINNNKLNILSLQERKVYILIKMGKTNKEIASTLHISVCTVKSHINNMYKKLGIRSRREIYNLMNQSA